MYVCSIFQSKKALSGAVLGRCSFPIVFYIAFWFTVHSLRAFVVEPACV